MFQGLQGIFGIAGFNKGMLQGIEKGKTGGKIEIAKNLLSQKVDINTISAATGLSVDEIQKLIKHQ